MYQVTFGAHVVVTSVPSAEPDQCTVGLEPGSNNSWQLDVASQESKGESNNPNPSWANRKKVLHQPNPWKVTPLLQV